MTYSPTFSHGGTDIVGWPAVQGNTTGPGRPIWIYGGTATSAMFFTITGTSGSITVDLECNAGPVDPITKKPQNKYWIKAYTGLVMAFNDTGQGKKLQFTVPFWRTNITARTGDTVLETYCAVIKLGASGAIAQPSYVPISSETTATGVL